MHNTITQEKLDKYFAITEEALAVAKGAINPERHASALEALDMVERYVSRCGRNRKLEIEEDYLVIDIVKALARARDAGRRARKSRR